MNWEDALPTALAWARDLAPIAERLRGHAALCSGPVGYYHVPVSYFGKSAETAPSFFVLYAPTASVDDVVRCKQAAELAGAGEFCGLVTDADLAAPECFLVKLAYSPALHRMGEWGNFFPGQYPGGIPNHPSPLAAMLTSGLLGAGVGWGTGKLLGAALPAGYGQNLGRTGAVLGGALGAGGGGLWGLTNLSLGKDFNDPSLSQGNPDEPDAPAAAQGMNRVPDDGVMPNQTIQDYVRSISPLFTRSEIKRAADAVRDTLITKQAEAAIEASVKTAYGTFGKAREPAAPTPLDVNINSLGQTLWDAGASAPLTATTLGAMMAASQFPDPRARPGWATMGQLGQFAERAGGDYQQGVLSGLVTNAVSDYLTGTLGGVAINATIGTPHSATTYGAVNAGLGVLGTVVSRLFGG